MKKALILGGTQFFGKRLVNLLLEQGVEITIATRGKTPDPFGERVRRVIIEREDKNSLESLGHEEEWDVVYDQTAYSPQEVLDVTEFLKGRVKRYILTSSQAVYDFGSLRREEDFNPFNYRINELKTRDSYQGYMGYQEAKRLCESVLFQKSGIPGVAVRFPIVVGKDDYTNRLKFHVDHVKEGMPMGIPDLDLRFGFISSKEAAEFLYRIAGMEFTGPINPGATGDISLGELIRMVEDTVGKTVEILKQTAPEHMSPYAFPGSWSVSNSKAVELGFEFTPVNELLEMLIEHYKTQD